jgi:DNA repair protein RAD50
LETWERHGHKEQLPKLVPRADTPQWQLAKGELAQMIENRKKTERTLENDYKNIDKQFKEQLIKTKVGACESSIRG